MEQDNDSEQLTINSQLSHNAWEESGSSRPFHLPSLGASIHAPQPSTTSGDSRLYDMLVETLGELVTEQAQAKTGNAILVSQLGMAEQNLYQELQRIQQASTQQQAISQAEAQEV